MQPTTQKAVGICLGASTVTLVEIARDAGAHKILTSESVPHLGNVADCLSRLLQKIDLSNTRVVSTGRKFRHALPLTSISEPEAVEVALRYVCDKEHPYRMVLSAGGETFILYHLDDEGHIQAIQTGNKCASGTGEFFLQQLGRMDTSLAEVEQLPGEQNPYAVSGRCSVFCKSDCTHALNKGVSRGAVVAGLANMMAEKILELLKNAERKNIVLTGGCVHNSGMVTCLKEEIDNLFIPQQASCFEALGAALWALDNPTRPAGDLAKKVATVHQEFDFHPPLKNFSDRVRFLTRKEQVAVCGDRVILGLDVGSTTTKAVIMRRSDRAILASAYLRTNGDPVIACRNVYQELADKLPDAIIIEGLGVTGSGRQLCGLHAKTDATINEIIAHARAVAHFDPEVETIFEIGGQDAKYTFLRNGVANDYAMNEACSAGTGSFLEEAAKESFGIDVNAISDLAYKGTHPPNFNDQCAAFIGSDIKGAVQSNIATEDILAGLVYSVCLNYINRVKGNRPIGRKIFMQGGVCYNKAVPAAMAALTGLEIIVPPDPGLMGAFGVAIETDNRIVSGVTKATLYQLSERTQGGIS